MIITNILCIDWLIFIIGWLIHLICCSTCPIIDWLTLSTDISTCHATWAGSMATLLGSIATWLATFFALISIHLAYKAFRGQVNASRRASFDATFTQIFAQHNTLRARVISHSNSFWCEKNVFTRCKEEFAQKGNQTVLDFWEHFNEKVIKNEVSVDFKNFFKYIYHEVTTVTDQEKKVLDNYTKKKYIDLIQAQMNNDELFCYLINQIYHYHKNETEDEVRKYTEILKTYDFFKEICKYIGKGNSKEKDIYTQHIENMLKDSTTNTYIKKFIHNKYLKHYIKCKSFKE